MSKERLEAIRHYYREMESFDPGTQSDINWLIEQAERVRESKEENINLKAIKAGNEELIKILEQQNKRYREAIKETKNIIEEAIVSLDNNEKVQGLEWAVKRVDEALEGEE